MQTSDFFQMVSIDLYRKQLSRHTVQRLNLGGLKRAAVILPLFYNEGEDHLIFNRRTDHLQHHPGQIAFPGGSSHPEDRSLLYTALRETDEEMGIKSGHIDVLGELDEVESIHGYQVSVFVGSIPYPYPFKINGDEIADVFELPIEALRDPAIFHIEKWEHRGRTHRVPFFTFGDHQIWGMTATILEQFLEITKTE